MIVLRHLSFCSPVVSNSAFQNVLERPPDDSPLSRRATTSERLTIVDSVLRFFLGVTVSVVVMALMIVTFVVAVVVAVVGTVAGFAV